VRSRVGFTAKLFGACVTTFATLLLSSQLASAQFTQQGPKLVGAGATGGDQQGSSVALSADGNTAIVGGPGNYYGSAGAARVYARSAGVWTQQGSKLVGTGAVGGAAQGQSVALSADGNTALVGGSTDNASTGAAWVYTRGGSVWTQQGSKLVGTGAVGNAEQGYSVALSADGNTAILGGPDDNAETGAGWVFSRSNGIWTQQGKLVGTGAAGSAEQGYSVALSADGNTAIVGAPVDNSFTGAAWVYTRSGGVWTQQGSKLVSNSVYPAQQGTSVALSADGNTAIVGAPIDGGAGAGAAWVYTRSGGVWTQQGSKLVATGAVGNAYQGGSVALSADGKTAIVGGRQDNGDAGAAWGFFLSGGVWTQQSVKLVGGGGSANSEQGWSIALSADGSTAILGGPSDATTGAAWVFTQPSLQVASNVDMTATGTEGGPFLPASFQYQLSATGGTANYSILGVPNWLTPSSTSGAASSGTNLRTPANLTAPISG
jgi:FG-GAP repeat